MDLLKMMGDYDLPFIIDGDAKNLEISEITEPRFNPPKDAKNLILLGELPENLKTLRRLERWYHHKIVSGESGDNHVKEMIVGAFFSYLFSLEYKGKVKKGNVIGVFKDWQVIAHPIAFRES